MQTLFPATLMGTETIWQVVLRGGLATIPSLTETAQIGPGDATRGAMETDTETRDIGRGEEIVTITGILEEVADVGATMDTAQTRTRSISI